MYESAKENCQRGKGVGIDAMHVLDATGHIDPLQELAGGQCSVTSMLKAMECVVLSDLHTR